MTFVVNYDHLERNPQTNKPETCHHALHPCGGRAQADATAKNLKLNKRVSNVGITESDEV